MKKSYVSLFIILFALSVTSLQAQIRIGGRIGSNISKLYANNYTSDAKLGVQVGAVGEYEIIESLSAQSGLLITTKGGNFTGGKTNLVYLDIPIHAIYKYDLGSISIYGKSGFDIFLGLTGKDKYNIGVTDKIDWGSGSNDDLKRIELGFHIEAGVELIENLQVGMSYNIGINDISASGNGSNHNRVFAITATYFFAEL